MKLLCRAKWSRKEANTAEKGRQSREDHAHDWCQRGHTSQQEKLTRNVLNRITLTSWVRLRYACDALTIRLRCAFVCAYVKACEAFFGGVTWAGSKNSCMTYEVFKRTGARVETPTISIVPEGRIAINSAAVRIGEGSSYRVRAASLGLE